MAKGILSTSRFIMMGIFVRENCVKGRIEKKKKKKGKP